LNPIPSRQYRHYKGHIYTVIGVTTPGQCPYLDAVRYFTCVHTESDVEQWFDAVMTGRDKRMWLAWAPRDRDMRFEGQIYCPCYPEIPHVLYSRPEDGGKVWARPLASWQSRVPPTWPGGRLAFRLGLVRGRERFRLLRSKS